MEGECIVRMEDITVQFPGVLALNKVHFSANRGEVHILLGENGAGKSTIMKVLAGINTDYTGRVVLKGEEIRCASVLEQRQRGISMIFQEMNLLQNLTVAEAIFMGRQHTTRSGRIDWRQMGREARRLLDSIGSDIPETRMVGKLSVGQMQMVEIAKALSMDADVIIMDEPTSALTEKEVANLFAIIRSLKAKGVAIVYISHRMEEIMQIGDRITVFRDGEFIKTMQKDDTCIEEIVSLMVGRELTEYYPRVQVEPGEKSIEVEHLVQDGMLHDISFYARSGEITGFYGLMGAGRTELMRAIFGADRFDSGVIKMHGKAVDNRSCRKAKQNGLALLTEDRKSQGLILEFDINKNISIPNLDKVMTRFGIIPRLEEENNQKLVERVRVKTPSLRQKVKNLSGGNQQKVVIAKWLNTDSSVIIFDEPTRGIDVGSKVEIYRIMNALKEQGKAVIMVSSELTECIGISDRLYVMHEGRITAQIEPDKMKTITEKEIIMHATATA
ncbi:MAG: sugar ABC transporter ATP-binding protein [Planctomycetes bacterium]|nr:sugar ABC transporter ATP-binding protein [Planctomycetota bacterium]